MPADKTDVVLVSGGLDSTIVALQNPAAMAVFVNYGHPYISAEWRALQTVFRDRNILSVKVGPGIPTPADRPDFVPARNLLLTTIAAQHAQGPCRVLLSGVKDDNVCDNTQEAHRAMSTILTQMCGYDVEVVSPCAHLTKAENAMLFVASNPGDVLLKTLSCYQPTIADQPCQDCGACSRWAVAIQCSVGCPWTPTRRITEDYLARLHSYSHDRQWSTLQAVNTGGPVVQVDIDGVLTKEVDGHDYATRTPVEGAGAALRRLTEDGMTVVLHTSRPECERDVTSAWLERHSLTHHALMMNKLPASVRIDDISRPSLEALCR